MYNPVNEILLNLHTKLTVYALDDKYFSRDDDAVC